MQTATANNPEIRSNQADDVNGLRTVRQTTNPNMLANGSFEYPFQRDWGGTFAVPGWGFKKSGPFHIAGANCDDVAGRKHGNCYAEFSGNDGAPGTSIFQDVAAYQGDGTNPNYLRCRRSMQLKAFLVDPNPQPGTSTPFGVGHRMQVGAMDTTPHLLLATARCAVLTT